MSGTLVGWPSLAALSRQVSERRISPTELIDLSYSRIHALNPHFRAFVSTCEDTARTQAREAERLVLRGEARPLEGIPLAVKDNTAVAGLALTNGSRSSSIAPVEFDAEVVVRLRAAGAIVVGKTSLPEFGAVPVTESALAGVCLNPWDAGRTCGGSSGGSAVAVATGMVPFAQGNDGGGSLRIPASCCGVVGLKPARGRISVGPNPDGSGMVSTGFITTRTADQAFLLDLTTGYARGDQFPAPAPRLPFSAHLAVRPRPLRIAWTSRPPVDAAVAAECAGAVEMAAGMLADLGHEVVQIDPGWTRDWLAREFRRTWVAGILATVLTLPPDRRGPEFLERHIRAMQELGQRSSGGRLLLSQSRLQAYARETTALWQRWDVVMTPTLAAPALAVGELFSTVEEDPYLPLDRADAFSPYTPLFNINGQPAVSLPLGWQDGFPIGVQLAAPPYREDLLLQLSLQLEHKTNWPARRPPAL